MRRKKMQAKQMRLGAAPTPQLPLPLADEVPSPVEEAVHWRLCRQCGRPIHPEAPGCGWCRKLPRRRKLIEDSGSLF
jgi:hypothetical protein